MKKQRIGITVKILGGLFLILLSTLLTVSIETFFFQNIRYNIKDMSQNKIPSLILGAELIMESQRIMSHVQDILVADNESIRAEIIREINASVQRKEILIDKLRRSGVNSDELDILSRQFEDVISSMNKLNQFISRRLELENKSIFDYKIQQVQLIHQLDEKLASNTFQVDALLKTINRIFTAIKADTLDKERVLNLNIRRFSLMQIVIPLICIFAGIFIYFYLKRSVIGRLFELRDAMRKNVQGYSEQVPIRGNDEITEMAQSVTYFISEIRNREDKLKEAKETAQAANLAKNTFLANMSHELRTPLNSILGYAQILKQETSIQDRQKHGLNIIEQSGNHLLSLIDDVLDLSKIELGRIDLYETDFELPALINKVYESAVIQAERKGIAFRLEKSGYMPVHVHGDEKRLRQILFNLINNAIKYTDHGKVIFRVECRERGNSRAALWFEVRDTGVGIASKHLDIIFDPFQQAGSQARQAMETGTGLGLIISRNLVELMNGKLYVKSHAGSGSTFRFIITLPIIRNAPDLPATLKRRIIGIKGNPPTILIVDDNPQNLALLTVMLKPLGFHILEAVSGREGLAKAEKYHPDVMIIDLFMPEMNGFECIKHIRNSSWSKNIRIITSSASVFEVDKQKSTEAGSDAFLAKPIKIEILCEQLQALLSLEWIYEESDEENSVENTELITLPLVFPSDEEIKIIYELSLEGNIKKLRECITELEQVSKPELEPFVKRMQELLRQYRLNDVSALLEPQIKRGNNNDGQ